MLIQRLADDKLYADAESGFNLALAYENMGRYFEAVQIWEKVVALNGDDQEAVTALNEAKSKINSGPEASVPGQKEDCTADNAEEATNGVTHEGSMLSNKLPKSQSIPRAAWPDALVYIKQRLPVIITNASLIPDDVFKDW